MSINQKTKKNKFDIFFEVNFRKAVDNLSVEQFGDMDSYRKRPSASKISQGCPYKVVQESKEKINYSMEQLIIFQRGHIAENIVEMGLKGTNYISQYKITSDYNGEPIEANIDFVINSTDRIVVVEAKSVTAPIDEPYESWILQVQFQMGLLLEQINYTKDIEAYIEVIDVGTGWNKSFKVDFNDALFEICLAKTEHLLDAFKGLCEPKAVVQFYCGSCPFKMSCPKQGLHAELAPETLIEDIKAIKEFNSMKKEIDKRKERVKESMVNLGLKQISNLETSSVITVKEVETTKFDKYRFKNENPELYKEYLTTSSSFNMTMI